MKTDLFQSCGHCWVFQICWHIECSTFTASTFSIWNSSSGILSPPLALFVVIFSKAHLTSHSRMSGSRWLITPLWLSGSWRSFLYSSFGYSCHLFYRLVPNWERSMSRLYIVTLLFNLYAEYLMRNAGLDEVQLESRLLGEISITSDMQLTPHLWQKLKKN